MNCELTPEQLMVQLSAISKRIVRKESLEGVLEPTKDSIKLEAAQMAKLYLSLLE